MDPSSIQDEEKNTYPSYYGDTYTRSQLGSMYFAEVFFRTNDSAKLERVTSDPYFWFSARGNSPGAIAARTYLAEATSLLTQGHLKAWFLGDADKPATFEAQRTYIEIAFGDTGTAAGSSSWNTDNDGRIYKSKITLRSDLADSTTPEQLSGMRKVLFHELGHSLGNAIHSGFINNIMSYHNGAAVTNTYSDYELDAWHLLFSLPVGKTLASIKEEGLLNDYIESKLFIHDVNIQTKGRNTSRNRASAGDVIEIFGSNLSSDFGCHSLTDSDMSAAIGSTILEYQKQKYTFQDTSMGVCDLPLRFKIPLGLSGDALLTLSRGKKTSNIFPIYLQ